jgi:peroxiredoxin/tetratricopeptide (TPR) repeat protein
MKLSVRFVFLLFPILIVLTSDSAAQTSRLEPERPRWGQILTVVYDAAAPGAKFTVQDEIYLVARLSFPGFGENLSAKMTRDGSRFRCQFSVRDNLSSASFHFVTRAGGWDEGAYLTSLIYRADGNAARGAYESKIGSGKYQEFFKQEIDLYPDNYSAYRARWAMALAVEGERAAGQINSEIRKLSGLRNETAELLYAFSYGHLMLGREEKSRELIRRAFTRFPDSNFTALAVTDYLSEAAGRDDFGDGPAEIDKIKLEIARNYPGTEFARNASTAMCKDQRAPLEVIEVIARQWIKAEPENPQAYFNLATAYKNQYQKYDLAAPLIEKAIGLLLEGMLHLYGDVNGKQTTAMLAEAYLTSADLAFRQNKTDKAVSAVKVAQTFEQSPPYAAHLLEAKIRLALSQEREAELAFIEAWRGGSQEAEERLKTGYKSKNGGLQGFDEYLLSAGNNKSLTGVDSTTKRPSPQFKVVSLDGKTFDLNKLQRKVVVLNLWFVACGPCRKEIPKLNQLVAEFKDKEVVFIAPSLDAPETLRDFLKTTAFNYHIIPNAEEIVAGKFNATKFPTHIVIDQDGQIELMLVGGGERRPEEVRRALLRLLNIQTSQQ